MNRKRFPGNILALCFVLGLPGLCAGEDAKTDLIVKRIAFNRDRGGMERVTLSCNRSCSPALFSIEGEHPRVVMDMKGVLQVRSKSRSVDTGGKLVRRVRSYLDKQTNVLRIVLDMEPSGYFRVRPVQDPSGAAYSLTILQDDTEARTAQEKRIKLLPPDPRPQTQGDKLPQRASGAEKNTPVKDTAALTVQGRAQLNDSQFSAAVDTFTRILADRPQDSLGYRLRGNAYDNLGERQKAVEDWTQAARLGDATVQSYLDFLGVTWRKNPAGERRAAPVGGENGPMLNPAAQSRFDDRTATCGGGWPCSRLQAVKHTNSPLNSRKFSRRWHCA